jgi:ABC-type branched-subunit amino acid transport system substrate-binding protein
MAHDSVDRNQLGQLLGDLYRRRRGQQGSAPIISIVKARSDASSPLQDLATWLSTGQPHPVPHVVVDRQAADDQGGPPAERDSSLLPDIDTADVVLIKDLLHGLAARMGTGTGGSYDFPHLDLVTALMTVRLRELTPRRRRELREVIRRRSSINAETVNTGRTLLEAANPLLRFLSLLPPLWIWIRSSGRIPFLGGTPFRWLLTQPHIVRDDQDRSFLGVAQRLTAGLWQNEAPNQVARVIVDAFLADLRHAFRARWFRRYRTTYPIVMLKNVTRANGGYPLLRMVNEVRNATGRDDPLVLWSESKLIPPFATDPDGRTSDRQEADLASRLEEWHHNARQLRRRRDDRTWYVVVRIASDRDPVLPPPPERPGVPWVRSRAATALVTAGLLLVPLGVYVAHSLAHCGNGLTWTGSSPTTQYRWDSDRGGGGECIGVSEDLFDFVTGAGVESFRKVRDTLTDRNERSVVEARTHGRPLITVAYLAALPRDPPGDALSAEREELAGIIVAQERQLELPDRREPLVRVLIANGGTGMAHGVAVAAMLRDIARADPTFVGVVGLNESRDSTVTTLRELAGYGIPVVAAPLSADRLADENPMYFQIAPQNRRQADVIAARIDDLGSRDEPGRPTTSRIYTTTDETDVYARNLAEDLAESLRSRGLQSDAVEAPDWYQAGRDACQVRGFVLYTGRPVPDFQRFLAGVSSSCPGAPPTIIGADDVSRYVADTERRGGNAVPFTYVSFAVLPGSDGDYPSLQNFSTTYNRLGFASTPGGAPRADASLDGHAALTYDATSAVIAGVRNLSGPTVAIPVTPLSLWQSLRELRGGRAIEGASGTIDFDGPTTGGVTPRKAVYMAEVRGGAVDPGSIAFCGLRSGSTQAGWCPP